MTQNTGQLPSATGVLPGELEAHREHYQIIAGGREFADASWMKDHLGFMAARSYTNEFSLTIVSGGARGADRLADEVARSLGITSVVIEADWEEYGRRAGYLRNVAMAEYVVERLSPLVTGDVVCFPGGKGTQMMRAIGRKHGLGVFAPRPALVSA